MATAWDDLMKLLSGANPQHLVSFLLPNARFKHVADKELKTRTIEADMLYFIEMNGKEGILHGEFQRYRDRDMGQRLWEYNALTTCITRKKVYSFAIYLRPGGTVVEPPHKIDFLDDEVVHIFYYKNIKL